MMTRYLDRYDNSSTRPWPVSPFVYPLDAANSNRRWPGIVRTVLWSLGFALGTVAIVLGMVSYL
jgi:hypothetical protein